MNWRGRSAHVPQPSVNSCSALLWGTAWPKEHLNSNLPLHLKQHARLKMTPSCQSTQARIEKVTSFLIHLSCQGVAKSNRGASISCTQQLRIWIDANSRRTTISSKVVRKPQLCQEGATKCSSAVVSLSSRLWSYGTGSSRPGATRLLVPKLTMTRLRPRLTFTHAALRLASRVPATPLTGGDSVRAVKTPTSWRTIRSKRNHPCSSSDASSTWKRTTRVGRWREAAA